MKTNAPNPAKRTILLVDDEVRLLHSVRRLIRSRWDVVTVSDPAEASRRLAGEEDFAVLVTDYKMPGLSGTELLAKARECKPDMVRIMLTGYADLNGTMSAVNDGSVFRILLKPCDQETMIRCLEDAVAQYDLVIAERELLNDTLNGSIEMLTDLLSIQCPAIFARCQQLREASRVLAEACSLEDTWDVEIAAMLADLGALSLSSDLLKRYLGNEILNEADRIQVESLPSVASRMVKHIPRMQEVAEIIHYQNKNYNGSGYPDSDLRGRNIPVGARILRLVRDYLRMESKGYESDLILETLQSADGYYDPRLVQMLRECREQLPSVRSSSRPRKALRPNELSVGCIPVMDILTSAGMLIIRSGVSLKPMHIARIQNFASAGEIRGLIEVILPD